MTSGKKAGARFTPGPWHGPCFLNDEGCQCTSILSEGYAGSICQVSVNNRKRIGHGGNDAPPLEEARANARLISAAPELLQSLREVLGWYVEGGHAVPRIYIDRANTAIAKATGGDV